MDVAPNRSWKLTIPIVDTLHFVARKESVMRVLKILLQAATLVSVGLAWAQSSIRPGEYEVISEIRLPGETTATEYTDVECITPEEAADFQSAMLEVISEDACGVSNVESSPGRMTFDADCDGVVSHAEIVFTEETIDVAFTMTVNGQTTTSDSQFKWIGQTCSANDE
jgi:hypothetical protein